MATPPDPNIIVDAHEDIAWNAVTYKRNFAQGAHKKRQLEAGSETVQLNGSATLGLPDALLGRVGLIFGTLYVSPAFSRIANEFGYETPAQAHRAALEQVDVYNRLADQYDQIRLVRTQGDLAAVLASWSEGTTPEQHKVGIVMLMEGADPILEPKEFEAWYGRGVRIVGPAWSETRYSGGTKRPGPLTALGRQLLEVMQSFNAVLDLSHMAEQAYLEAVDRYSGLIIASHSNPRRFVDADIYDRHLSDEMIRRLVERGGVMGVVFSNRFMFTNYSKTDPKSKYPLTRTIDIIDHVCQIAGSARHIGIGTDFDGGFGSERIPAELDTLADLLLLGKSLAGRGYKPEDVQAILGGNFIRILRAALPL